MTMRATILVTETDDRSVEKRILDEIGRSL